MSTPDFTPEDLLMILEKRFNANQERHPAILWEDVLTRLNAKPDALKTLSAMEASGGEPDVVDFDAKNNEFLFVDCAAESPKGRRSLCYDRAAWEKRKEHKPASSAMETAAEMGIELLSEKDYRALQELGTFDQKTSSWLRTPAGIRKAGGAIFGDFRYGTVFIYHNGAESYYAARGFRGKFRV
ncbi:DUF4256 domain-containing protein [Chryseobacterium sp. MFBS3-17]|uniref:DUF4256 domain-containing protein n=1 Tax=Chryseobacterium sp. MFBS3-17 TaxID=2886689 RepID=UPI001D0F2309|nr:DUF4256 domain-containing protein [Chryseobacterium sp. MFBS3-17]MCC2591117.1 DUF4256 domain-containing protein [Chryseobacterium sp. MFBS3-17]